MAGLVEGKFKLYSDHKTDKGYPRMRNSFFLLLMLMVFPAMAWADVAEEAFDREDYETALRLFEPRAQAGEAVAQYYVGWMYQHNVAVTRDYKKALTWYLKAARQGQSKAQFYLGYLYEAGHGVTVDHNQATSWYRKSAEQGFIKAQMMMGMRYTYGDDDDGVDKDYTMAALWYHKAAVQGDAGGILHFQSMLAKLGYDPGPPDGVFGDRTRDAAKLFFRDYEAKGTKVIADTPKPIQVIDKMDKSTASKDTTPPKINLQRDIAFISEAKKTIRGQALDASGVAIVTVNQEEAELDENGNFSITILLKPGKNNIVITATDIHKNQATKTFELERKTRGVQPDPLADEIKTGEYYALLIAVEHYQHDDVNNLDHPVNDAGNVKKILQQYSFKPKNVTVLKNPKRDEIIDAFEAFDRKITKQDNLLIFYAGHGHWNKKNKQGYWLPSDASKNSTSRWLSNSTIRDHIRAIESKHTLLVSDACFSGGIFKTRKAFDDAPTATNELYKLPSRKAMTSGVLKAVPDKSVFIEYFIKRLRDNEHKYLSSQQLYTNFRTAVINNSPLQQVPQFGEIRESGDEGGDFIFVRSGK